jgi:hypothetical protein
MEKERTSMTLFVKTKKRLDGWKMHPRQSYDELLNTMLDFVEKESTNQGELHVSRV